jgi:tRNA-2-methylthio-N6-dimethylallyladenosine synthase
LLNTCSVREKAERKVYTRIGELRATRPNKHDLLVGVMGCVAQLEGDAVFEHASSVNMVIGTRATDRIPVLIERARAGERRVLDLDERGEQDSWDVSPVERHSPHVAFIPIIEGCNKFCSFCIVPYSRGRERSRPASEIIAEAKRLQALGYKTSIATGRALKMASRDSLAQRRSVVSCAQSLRLACRASSLRRLSRVIFIRTSFPQLKRIRTSVIGFIYRCSRGAIAFSN